MFKSFYAFDLYSRLWLPNTAQAHFNQTKFPFSRDKIEMAKLSKFILNSLALASVHAQEGSTFQVASCNSDVS